MSFLRGLSSAWVVRGGRWVDADAAAPISEGDRVRLRDQPSRTGTVVEIVGKTAIVAWGPARAERPAFVSALERI